MSESKLEIELPPLDEWCRTQISTLRTDGSDEIWRVRFVLECRERQLRGALQRISFLEAEFQTVLDRAERYMDLCAEKDKEIAQLKHDSQNACASDFCHHTETAHCNLTKEGMRGCCFCLCENFILEENNENS